MIPAVLFCRRAVALALAAAALIVTTHPARAAVPAGCKVQQLVELPVTMVGTRPSVEIKVNGKAGQMLLDTGAFYSMFTPQAAQAFGLHSQDESRVHLTGIGGAAARTQSTTVREFTLADVPFHNVEFLVADAGGGAFSGLLGENILGTYDVEYDLANGVVRIFKPEKCGSSVLAYWVKGAFAQLAMLDGAPGDRHIYAYGQANGQRIRLTFDSGASRSIMTLRAAARAGVTPQSPGAAYGGQNSGIGSRRIDTWIAPFDSFKLDSEEIQHTKLRIGGVELMDSDMLLGADFFLSHRIYVSNSQRKIYFTYNGGQVFQLEAGMRTGAPVTDRLQTNPLPATTTAALDEPASAPKPSAPQDLNTPADAAGFARRGSAFMSRLDYPHAIEDFTRASELEPANPKPLYQRGLARTANRQPILAMSDFDQVLRQTPDDASALMARAALYNASGDKVHARADLDAADLIHSKDPEIVLQLANAYGRLGFTQDALTGYDRWIAANRDDPGMAAALSSRCYARLQLKTDLDKALNDCNASLKLNPRNLNAVDNRGMVHLMRGEFAAAVADCDTVLKERPKAALVLYARGIAKQKEGLKEAGDADIAAAVALAPKIAEQGKRLGMTAP